MKIFTEDNGSFRGKVNYVDSGNRVLGFDMERSCCESFGHGVFPSPPTTGAEAEADDNVDAYVFSDDVPTPCMPSNDRGGGLAFRIVSDGQRDLWVVIWNHHNGYYVHGFTFTGTKGGSL